MLLFELREEAEECTSVTSGPGLFHLPFYGLSLFGLIVDDAGLVC